MNKEEYNQKRKDLNQLIDLEKENIKLAERKIRDLEGKLLNHKWSCNHKHDDGTSALKETSYWHSEPYEVYNSWTDEMDEEDGGYTVYGKECTICGEEQ